MCITTGPARLSNTRIYAAEVMKPDGRRCHVIGYQNSVVTEPGPNAMLLPFPAAERVAPENLVNAARFPKILEAYEDAVRRQNATLSRGDDKSVAGAAGTDDFTVFESGSYTVALVQKASALRDALEFVPKERRPEMPMGLMFALARYYPGWPIALCCFEGVKRSEAYEQGFGPEPLLWWYEPKYPDVLFAPGLDAHDGSPPDGSTSVERDHVVAFGSYLSPARPDERLRAAIAEVPEEHRWMFIDRVHGRIYQGSTRNGDFVSSATAIRKERYAAWLTTQVATPPFGPDGPPRVEMRSERRDERS